MIFRYVRRSSKRYYIVAKIKEFCARIIFLLQKACGYRRNYVNEKIGACRFKKTGIFIVYHVLCLIYRERINMA